MQANSTIQQSASPDIPNAYIENDATTWTHTSIELADAQVVVADGEAAAWDYGPNLLATLDLRLFRRTAPYALQSESKRALYDLCKQSLDVVGSLLLLMLTLPLFLLAAICIKMTSPGPVLYRHQRLGLGGKEFWCLKFRTMTVDAEDQLKRDPQLRQQFEENFKIKSDPRVTLVGAILRKTSLDELPQLINVLRKEMSLIGPRPIVAPELSKYSIYGHKLLSVKPGLSGLWQVCGRSDVAYPERVLLDMHYIDHRCLSLDINLMLRTPLAIFWGHGAC